MDQVAVFVDAGYLFAQGSHELFGEKLRRGELVLDEAKAVAELIQFAQSVSGKRLLRVYWYDGTSSGPTAQHASIAYLDDTKVRLGFVNSVGEQKGVDSLLVTDMITLARNKSMSDAVLLAGDEDLRVGVQQAQEHGVRVHLIGIRPARGSQSSFLLQEADTKVEWDSSVLNRFLSRREAREVEHAAVAEIASVQSISQIRFDLLFSEMSRAEVAAIVTDFDAKRGIPKTVDAKLLALSRAALKRDLTQDEKRQVREQLASQARAFTRD